MKRKISSKPIVIAKLVGITLLFSLVLFVALIGSTRIASVNTDTRKQAYAQPSITCRSGLRDSFNDQTININKWNISEQGVYIENNKLVITDSNAGGSWITSKKNISGDFEMQVEVNTFDAQVPLNSYATIELRAYQNEQNNFQVRLVRDNEGTYVDFFVIKDGQVTDGLNTAVNSQDITALRLVRERSTAYFFANTGAGFELLGTSLVSEDSASIGVATANSPTIVPELVVMTDNFKSGCNGSN